MSNCLSCKCADSWGDVAPLVMRLALGAIFAYHGYQKVFVMTVDNVAIFLGNLSIPFALPMAYILSYGELIGGVLLIVGLFTHWISKFNIIIAAVAFYTVHMSKGFSIQNGGYEFIMLIGAVAISLMITGAGKYSLDAMWCSKGKKSDASTCQTCGV